MLSAFRTFVRFALVWFCLFPPSVSVWGGGGGGGGVGGGGGGGGGGGILRYQGSLLDYVKLDL